MESDTRRLRGKSKKSLELVAAAAEILKEIQPATVRAVCYRLFVAGLIPDMGKNATDKISKQLVWAREQGKIPWRWIVDETRSAERASVWGSTDEIIDTAIKTYRRDNWQEQPNAIEVWSEKGTVRGTISPILYKYAVTFRVLHGFGSATTLNSVAARSRYSKKPLTVLYVGDFDCSGMFMSDVDIPERIARYDGLLNLKRIALTQSDVMSGNLPSFDAATKVGDSRHRWFTERYGRKCWELDALSPPILRERVEKSILDLIDQNAWSRALEIERVEVESMRHFGERLAESKSRQASKCSGPRP